MSACSSSTTWTGFLRKTDFAFETGKSLRPQASENPAKCSFTRAGLKIH